MKRDDQGKTEGDWTDLIRAGIVTPHEYGGASVNFLKLLQFRNADAAEKLNKAVKRVADAEKKDP